MGPSWNVPFRLKSRLAHHDACRWEAPRYKAQVLLPNRQLQVHAVFQGPWWCRRFCLGLGLGRLQTENIVEQRLKLSLADTSPTGSKSFIPKVFGYKVPFSKIAQTTSHLQNFPPSRSLQLLAAASRCFRPLLCGGRPRSMAASWWVDPIVQAALVDWLRWLPLGVAVFTKKNQSLGEKISLPRLDFSKKSTCRPWLWSANSGGNHVGPEKNWTFRCDVQENQLRTCRKLNSLNEWILFLKTWGGKKPVILFVAYQHLPFSEVHLFEVHLPQSLPPFMQEASRTLSGHWSPLKHLSAADPASQPTDWERASPHKLRQGVCHLLRVWPWSLF